MPRATARLAFRRWTPTDLHLAAELWGDAAVTALIAAQPMDRAAIEARLASEIALERDHGVQYWPVFLRDGGAFIGCCGLRPHDPAERIFELGVHLRSACWGRGYATEAARGVITHAFTAVGAAALFAGHHPDNIRSRVLLERLGFRYTHDEPYVPTGRLHRSCLLRPHELRPHDAPHRPA